MVTLIFKNKCDSASKSLFVFYVRKSGVFFLTNVLSLYKYMSKKLFYSYLNHITQI